MLGKVGVFRRGDGDFVAGFVTAVNPVLEFDPNTGQWNDTGNETYDIVTFEGGVPKSMQGIAPDDFGDNTESFSGDYSNKDNAVSHAELTAPQATALPSSPVLATGVQPSEIPTPDVRPSGPTAAPEVIPQNLAAQPTPVVGPNAPSTAPEVFVNPNDASGQFAPEATSVVPPGNATDPESERTNPPDTL